MKYFDASPMIGAHFAPREGKFFSAEDLIEEMDFFGIDEALVYNGLAREYDFQTGNSTLMESIKEMPRLHACWVAGLHHFGVLSEPRNFVKEAIASGVKILRLFFGGPLSDFDQIDVLAYRHLFDELEKHLFPVIIEFESGDTLSSLQIIDLDKLLAEFPKLPVILATTRTSGLEIRALCSRMEKFINLHLMTCGLHGNGLIEAFVSEFGHDRLVFGTNFPWFGAGQTKIALAYTNLSEQARQAIAYENLDRLIRRIK